jgi:hypothetical protein
MRAPMILLLIVAGCAPAVTQPAAAPTARPAVLRILDITPPIGARVDSSTVLVARLAYHIPDFDPDRSYVITGLFAQLGGQLSSRGNEGVTVGTPFGVATIRLPVAAPREIPVGELASPLTGVFFLLRHDSVPSIQDTVYVGDQTRIRVSGSRASVQARSHTFYYNGAGPSRTHTTDLVGILEEYWTYRNHKALAVAYESDQRWTYGYGFGYPSSEVAVERALEECRASVARRQITAPCRIVASDDEAVAAEPDR